MVSSPVDEHPVGQEAFGDALVIPAAEEESSGRRVALAQDLGERGLATEFDPSEAAGVLGATRPGFLVGASRCVLPAQLKALLLAPCPRSAALVECRITRRRNRGSKLTQYTLETDSGQFLMAARRKSCSRPSTFVVTVSQASAATEKASEATIGEVKSDLAGLEFVAYGAGVSPRRIDPQMPKAHAVQLARQEHALVQYCSSLWGSKPRGPRKMTVVIPRVLPSGERRVCRTLHPETEGLEALQRSGSSADLIEGFQNKPPKWNDQIGAFVLNFNKRVTKASVKNFQLTNSLEPDTVFLQFGRVDKDVFNMDFRYPLSPFQAFAICLSSFDYKFCCE